MRHKELGVYYYSAVPKALELVLANTLSNPATLHFPLQRVPMEKNRSRWRTFVLVAFSMQRSMCWDFQLFLWQGSCHTYKGWTLWLNSFVIDVFRALWLETFPFDEDADDGLARRLRKKLADFIDPKGSSSPKSIPKSKLPFIIEWFVKSTADFIFTFCFVYFYIAASFVYLNGTSPL